MNPSKIDPWGGRKFVLVFVALFLSWVALMTDHMSDVQFVVGALGLVGIFVTGNVTSKNIVARRPDDPEAK